MKDTERKSAIYAAQIARERTLYEFDVSEVLGLEPGKGRIKIRVPTKREQDLALAGAHTYLARLCEKTPTVRESPKIVNDTEAAFILAVACRDIDEPDKYPAWPTGEVIHDRMTADQIGSLLSLVIEVRAKEGHEPPLSDEQVEACFRLASQHADTEVPDITLATMKHHYLVQLYVLTVAKLKEARELLATKLDEAQP